MRLSFALSGATLLGITSASLYNTSPENHTCVLQPPVRSCSTKANPLTVDTCCTETYGGLLLSTQFWSTYTGLEDQGQKLPPSAWTLHGLWPDFCNGSYTQYCDLSRQYDPDPSPDTTSDGTEIPPYTGPNIGTFLEPFGKYDLLAWMNKYWIAQSQANSDFWGHEFSKHGTCYSTFDLPCYGPEYVEHEDVVDFFQTAITYYQRLPTFDWLADAGITPSNETTYSLADIQNILTQQYGAVPFIGCSGPRHDGGYTVLSEVWYYFHVDGRPQAGRWSPVNASDSYRTTCATSAGAILYPERTNGSEWAA